MARMSAAVPEKRTLPLKPQAALRAHLALLGKALCRVSFYSQPLSSRNAAVTSAGGWEPTRDGTGGCSQPRFPHLYNGCFAAPTRAVHTADPTAPSCVNSETRALKLKVILKDPTSPLGGCFLNRSPLRTGTGKLLGYAGTLKGTACRNVGGWQQRVLLGGFNRRGVGRVRDPMWVWRQLGSMISQVWRDREGS